MDEMERIAGALERALQVIQRRTLPNDPVLRKGLERAREECMEMLAVSKDEASEHKVRLAGKEASRARFLVAVDRAIELAQQTLAEYRTSGDDRAAMAEQLLVELYKLRFLAEAGVVPEKEPGPMGLTYFGSDWLETSAPLLEALSAIEDVDTR